MTFHHRPPPHLAAEHARERAALHALRGRIERTIERDLARIDRCLAALDLLDGDPDLEPSLSGRTVSGPTPGGDDREAEDEHDEPSLGAPNPQMGMIGYESRDHGLRLVNGLDQTRWAAGATDDRELGDDNGIADGGGEAEQRGAVWFGSVDELDSVSGQPLVRRGGRLVPERWA